MKTHTSGPWHSQGCDGMTCKIFAHPTGNPSDDEEAPNEICDVFYQRSDSGVFQSGETIANARIAAAPELLAALQLAASRLYQIEITHPHLSSPSTLAAIKTALNKAEGR